LYRTNFFREASSASVGKYRDALQMRENTTHNLEDNLVPFAGRKVRNTSTRFTLARRRLLVSVEQHFEPVQRTVGLNTRQTAKILDSIWGMQINILKDFFTQLRNANIREVVRRLLWRSWQEGRCVATEKRHSDCKNQAQSDYM
jgi:hypothetical protein